MVRGKNGKEPKKPKTAKKGSKRKVDGITARLSGQDELVPFESSFGKRGRKHA